MPLARGLAHLIATMDGYSHRVQSPCESNALEASFCIDALNEAIERHGVPEILNTDRASQCTSDTFTGVLKQHDIRISIDGKVRWVDNVFVERLRLSIKYKEANL